MYNTYYVFVFCIHVIRIMYYATLLKSGMYGVRGGFLLKVGGFSLKLYHGVSCVYPDVS